ncbi:hypothetical protein SS50377_23972 [Spironucleus salmonicida]|uniref:Uncharacterized protein n=1 Tax=Spironucleus salmonicida TaxID=348837 RepID=V6LEK7_9EUKA|nr:hypothetical protein SS50377_23972 [Spironucleus salmonicida]|eukprot:EST42922.1 Hypothetical protein SS50377_17455 [Spironucleus salmonicida]
MWADPVFQRFQPGTTCCRFARPRIPTYAKHEYTSPHAHQDEQDHQNHAQKREVYDLISQFHSLLLKRLPLLFRQIQLLLLLEKRPVGRAELLLEGREFVALAHEELAPERANGGTQRLTNKYHIAGQNFSNFPIIMYKVSSVLLHLPTKFIRQISRASLQFPAVRAQIFGF